MVPLPPLRVRGLLLRRSLLLYQHLSRRNFGRGKAPPHFGHGPNPHLKPMKFRHFVYGTGLLTLGMMPFINWAYLHVHHGIYVPGVTDTARTARDRVPLPATPSEAKYPILLTEKEVLEANKEQVHEFMVRKAKERDAQRMEEKESNDKFVQMMKKRMAVNAEEKVAVTEHEGDDDDGTTDEEDREVAALQRG